MTTPGPCPLTVEDAGRVRRRYAEGCVFIQGRERPSGPGVVCERSDGTIVDGVVGVTPRIVEVALEYAGKAEAARLTPAFDRIMPTVR